MANLKTQFSELRKTTPKHVQWLLLAAAFIVVLILLTLLLRSSKNKDNAQNSVDTVNAVLSIDPDTLDWSNVKVGETQTQRFVVAATGPIKVDQVRMNRQVPGLAAPKTTCTNIGQINDKLSCTISLEYSPTAAADVSALAMFIDWRGAAQPAKMNQTKTVNIAIGAIDVAVQPAPVAEPEPIQEPEPVRPTLRDEIEEIAKPAPFVFTQPEPEPEPVVAPIAPGMSEPCDEFAFAGYNMAGQQIGWIKPSRGSYKFHPFSDKDCTNPTGTYNPDNGNITDASGKKLGTDVEHIGFGTISGATAMPQLSNPVETKSQNKARQVSAAELMPAAGSKRIFSAPPPDNEMISSGVSVVSTKPYDRTFILRQYKPIPATIVSEIRADARLLNADHKLPVIATVDRNVYSDNGRTIIIPTGTTLYGYVTGDVPGPYKAIGRMEVRWYQFVRPDGVEFNFNGDANDPFSADAQGRAGVPGRGSTDYMEQFVMPMLTAVVPAAVNLIAPISDTFVNQIDLDNNTVTQTGEVRSSELAKNEIITAWNKVAQKLLVDMMDNTVPPFSISAGTRITVFSPVDLQVTCGPDGDKKCAISNYGNDKRATPGAKVTMADTAENAGSMVGQVRSFNLEAYCDGKGGVSASPAAIQEAGFDYRTVVFYCQSAQYVAINNAKQAAVYANQQQTGPAATGMIAGVDPKTGAPLGTKDYNEQVLGLKYNTDGTIKNPFQQEKAPVVPTITCEDGMAPDANGCCAGETYTDMGEQGFNCCPAGGGDCFPPII